MMRAVGVLSHLTPKAWPLIEGWVAAALQSAKANQVPDEIREQLSKALLQLWLAWDPQAGRALGCCITEIYDTANGRTCNLVVVAGSEFERWRPLTETIKAWARANGCVRLEATGRAGWQRAVKADGWKAIRTTVEMEL
jgi:hypothetical protein